MSLPNKAAPRVNCVPVSCIPSPESPAKRMVTRSSWRSATGLASVMVIGLRWRFGAGWGSRALGGCHALVGARWQVEELLRERLGKVLQDIDGSDDTDEQAVVIDERHVPGTTGLHELDRVADRLVQVEGPGVRDHHRLDRLAQVNASGNQLAEDVPLGEHAEEVARGVGHEHGIAGAGLLDPLD